jgi:hypothetical protein
VILRKKPPRSLKLGLALVLLAGLAAAPLRATSAGVVKAGVAVVDATWHVGASAGQYATDYPCPQDVPPNTDFAQKCLDSISHIHDYDPFLHQTRRAPSYGIQSRESVRALVIEGADGTRVAMMKNDLYIPQDLVDERIATILEDHDRNVMLGLEKGPITRINHSNLMVAVSHNHSSPYYSTPSWGVWTFQDVFDLRFFEYFAQQSAKAVIDAVAAMVPVRMGAASIAFDVTQRHSFGGAIADDGTPAGYPKTDNDKVIAILRFDDISNPIAPKPLAIFMSLGQHPEFLEGNNLISGDYIAPLERMVNAETGATLVFSQNNTGTSEPDRNCEAHPCSMRTEFSHREYAQDERGARAMADAVRTAWQKIGAGDASGLVGYIPFSSDFPVKMADRQFAPPVSHPYPSVSNCRTHEAFDGNPGIPILGLPDCERITEGQLKPVFDQLGPLDPGVTYDKLRAAGVPIPDNYGGLSYTGLEETFQVHLQAIRLGEVLITVCPCEQWADQSRDIKTRADKVPNNIWLGFDWSAQCLQAGDDTWTCPNPSDPMTPLTGISDYLYKRMRAQVFNDAKGWDKPGNALYAEYEPYDPAKIKGNYTHEELSAQYGYDFVMPVGMANDYWGYIATYREYQRGDHYRKALTGLGAHSSDFLATRLVRMGGSLKGCPQSLCPTGYNALDQAYMVDGVNQHARAELLGRVADTYLTAYDRLIPPDGGTPGAFTQPNDITRFDVASFTWTGGSNYTDSPQVRVQRLVNGSWVEQGNMSGEIPVTVDYPDLPAGTVPWLTGSFQWHWTALFEAFDSDIDTGRGNQTPAGTYKFVVDGMHRSLTGAVPYHVESATFQIRPWDGITVPDIAVGPGGSVSFSVGPSGPKTFFTHYVASTGDPTTTINVGPIDYPDTWRSRPLPTAPPTGNKLFPRLERTVIGGEQRYCFPCTFRPWADTGTVAHATLTVVRAGGSVATIAATFDAGSGRWVAAAGLGPGDTAYVAAGGITDAFGEYNGAASATVTV